MCKNHQNCLKRALVDVLFGPPYRLIVFKILMFGHELVGLGRKSDVRVETAQDNGLTYNFGFIVGTKKVRKSQHTVIESSWCGNTNDNQKNQCQRCHDEINFKLNQVDFVSTDLLRLVKQTRYEFTPVLLANMHLCSKQSAFSVVRLFRTKVSLPTVTGEFVGWFLQCRVLEAGQWYILENAILM